jgi:hypothetical protein
MFKKFQQQHEAQALVPAREIKQVPLVFGYTSVVPFFFVNPGAFSVHHQRPSEKPIEKFPEFPAVPAQKIKIRLVVFPVKIRRLQQQVQHCLHPDLLPGEKLYPDAISSFHIRYTGVAFPTTSKWQIPGGFRGSFAAPRSGFLPAFFFII